MDGIAVLKTLDGYRVAPVRDYDLLFGNYDENMVLELNTQELLTTFGECVTIDTEAEALEVARGMMMAFNELPAGIRVLRDYRNKTFEELKNGKTAPY